jgi:hypothetical protein
MCKLFNQKIDFNTGRKRPSESNQMSIYLAFCDDHGEDFFQIGTFLTVEDAVKAVETIDLSCIDSIQCDDVSISIREFEVGMFGFQKSSLIKSFDFKKEYDDEKDDLLWRKR